MIRINSVKLINTGFDTDKRDGKRINSVKDKLKNRAAKLLKINPSQIAEIKIAKHPIDARNKS